MGSTIYKLKIEANKVGESFSMGAVNFVDASSSSTLALSSSVTAKSLPENGQGVYVDFSGDTYHIEMIDDELSVSGGEEGRLTAYFDGQNRLQVVAGGTLSGQIVTVTSDGKISGNSDNAALFGLTTTKMRFASTPFTASAGLPNLKLNKWHSSYCRDEFSRCVDNNSGSAKWYVDYFQCFWFSQRAGHN